MNRKFTLALGVAFLATAIPVGGSLLAQERNSLFPPGSKFRQDQTRPNTDTKSKTFSGKIPKSNGQFVLQDSTAGTSYRLDDQKNAQKYAGKSVLVTGTLDESSNTIRVQKIETAA